MTKDDVKILDQISLYEGFVKVKQYGLQHKLFAGGWTSPFTREVMIRAKAAAVLPYDPVLDRVVLQEQFRVGAISEQHNPWLIEIVAGLLEEGETPGELIHREAQEEAGLTILDVLPIYDYWVSAGASNEYVNLFCGRVDSGKVGGIHGLPEEHEDIRVFTVSSQEAFMMAEKGQIKNAICLLAILWLQLHKEQVREKWL